MRTLLLGLGNDLRGDDAIGLHVVDYVRSLNICSTDVSIERTLVSGIHLLSYFPNYEKVCIVDSVQVKDEEIGKFWELSPEELKRCDFSMRVTHGIGIHSLLDILRMIGYENPREVKLFLIGIKKMNDYYYECLDNISSSLRNIVPCVGQQIVREIY